MGIPERLIEIRKKNGYTRKQLAEELGYPYRTITNYEMGEREPGHTYIIEVAKKFDVTTDYLLGISDSQKKSPCTAEAAQGDNLDEQENQIMNFVKKLTPDQKQFLIAALKTLLEQGS